MVQKQDGRHFVLFSNGPDHWKTEQTEQYGAHFVNHLNYLQEKYISVG